MSTATLPALDGVIGWIESRNDPFALRFEPSVFSGSRFVDYALLQVIQQCNNCSEDTSRVIASTSWGAFQVMGFNLYNSPFNYRGKIATFACDANKQLQIFYDYVDVKNIAYTVSDLAASALKREHFGLLYNGSASYADNIVASLKHYGVNVT